MITYGPTTLTSYNTITKIEVYYYKSTSATDLAGGSWSTTKPTWENGKYIWQKIKTTYEGKLENGQFYSESDPVNITGQQGATGTAAYSYKLNASDSVIGKTKTGEYTIDKITFTATYKQGTGAVTAYTGRFKIEITADGTTWTTQYTSSGNESSKEFTIPENIISVRCSLYQSGGTSTLLDITTIPVVKDGIDAVGLRDSIPYYLASDKQTGVTRLDQGWTRFKPELTTEKRYLWVYYVSRYSEGDTQPELIEIKNDIVSFENHGDESPVENCVIDIEPVQDLHGYDSPWPDGGGENLLGGNALLKNARNYVQLTTETDEYFQFSASATIDSELSFSTGTTFADNTQYTLIFTLLKTTGVGSNIRIYYTNDTYDNLPSLGEDNVKETIVFVTDADKTVREIVKTNQSGQTRVYYNECGVFEGVRTIADYTPYSNICPISGWTGAQVARTGKNLFVFDATKVTTGETTAGATRGYYPLGLSNCTLSFSAELIEGESPSSLYINIGKMVNGKLEVIDSIITPEATYERTYTYGENEQAVLIVSNSYTLTTKLPSYNVCVVMGSTPQAYESYTGNTYSITFPSEAGTVYSGELDVTNGVLTVDRAMVDLGTLDWINATDNRFYTTSLSSVIKKETDGMLWIQSSMFRAVPSLTTVFNSANAMWLSAKGNVSVSRIAGTTTELIAEITGQQLVYELAEPIIYTLTPQEITMLTGQNHIFSDTGQTAISYYDNQTSTDPYVDYSATSAFEVAQSVSDTVGALQTPYKEVEWVESTGKQYIYTDWKPPIKTWGFEIDFLSRNATGTSAGAWNETTNVNGYGNIFGVRSTSGVNNVQLSSYNKGLLRIGNGTNIATGFKTDHTRQTIKLHNNTLTKTDGTTATVTRVDEDSSKNYCNMTIFALYSDALRQQSTGSINEPSSTRIYSLKFYDGDTLTVDLVGAIRKADNVTGLYDKVTKHFYPAPGMLYGSDVGDIITDDTITENLNKTDVKVTVINKNRSRMWEANVPFHKLEDGQKLTVTYSYGGIVGSVETSKLIGWNDTSSNSNVYLKLTYPNGDTTEWIPCYYSNTARLTTHYDAGTPITFTYHENLLQNATETAGGSAVVRGFFANASYYSNTSYTQYSNNVKAGANGIKCNSLIMQDGEDTWSCFYSGAYKSTNTGKPAYTGGFRLGKVLYSSGSGAQTSNSSLDTYYNYKEGVVTSTIYDAYPVDLRYSTNCATTLTTQRPVYLVGTVESDGLFHLDIGQWWTQTIPTYEDGKVYVYLGVAYSTYQLWLATENPAYVYYNNEFILYDKALTLQNIATLKDSLETQIDGKVETWCQKTNPALSWDATERPNHTGDLWYYTGESDNTYKNNTTYQYNGSTNTWTAYSANPDLFDKIDGKAAIYYGTTSSVTSAEEGDYLVDSTDGSSYRWDGSKWVKVTDYKTAIDNIEIGGRNLLLNTADLSTHYGNVDWIFENDEASYTATTESWPRLDLSYNPAIGFSKQTDMSLIGSSYLTLSIDVKCEGDINGYFHFQPVIYGDDNKRRNYPKTHTTGSNRNAITPTNEWKRYSFTINADYENSDEWMIDSRYASQAVSGFGAIAYWNSTGTIHIRRPKLECGNKPTDWTLAPEDVENAILDVQDTANTALNQSIEYIVGTQTATTGSWTGVTRDSTLLTGKNIAYKLPYSGSGNASLTLTLSDGTTTGAIAVYLNTTRATTHFGAGSVINMTYDGQYWRITSIPNSNTIENVVPYFTGKTGTVGIWRYSLFMRDENGTYQNICTASDGTVTASNSTVETTKKANLHGFEVGSPIWYANSAGYNANSNITGNNAIYSSTSAIDSRYSLNTERKANSLTPYLPVYLVGEVRNDNLFHLDTVWWTQTPTDSSKVYVLIGGCYDSTTSNVRITLYEQNNWYKYVNGKLEDYTNRLAELAASTATAYITDTTDNGIMVHPENDTTSGWSIAGAIELFKTGISYIKLWIDNNIPKIRIGKEDSKHVLIDNDSVDIVDDETVLASFGETARIGKENQGHITIDNDSVDIKKDNNLLLATFGANGLATYVGSGESVFLITTQADTSTATQKTESVETAMPNATLVLSYPPAIGTTATFEVTITSPSLNYTFTDTVHITEPEEGVIVEPGDHEAVSEGSSIVIQRSYDFPRRRTYIITQIEKDDVIINNADVTITANYTAKAAAMEYRPSYTLGTRASYEDTNVGVFSFAEGDQVIAKGYASHAEGQATIAIRDYSHAEGKNTTAVGYYSHAEGYETTANSAYTHAEGCRTIAGYPGAHAEGQETTASGSWSHAEGYATTASGNNSHAEGYATTASGNNSHASGNCTIASSNNQFVIGKYNNEDIYNKYAFILGNGTANNARSNALAITWDGDTEFALDTTASSGTTDAGLYDAITALGWENDVIV